MGSSKDTRTFFKENSSYCQAINLTGEKRLGRRPKSDCSGEKSLFKWKNFKALFKKKREWWDMLPPKVPPREYRVLYLDIPKKWPIRSLLLEEPDEPKNYMIQSHTTEIHLVKPVMIDLHAVVCQVFEDSEPSERAAAASDEEYYSS